MYTLSGETLEVAVLDPVADQERFGVRYCTGGYIFQVTDRSHGPLLSGPTYPHSFNWFDGQGIPDAFNLGPLQHPEDDSSALIIGIGECDLQAREVLDFCHWQVEQGPGSIVMKTTQAKGHFALELERTVALHGRTLRSNTLLKNTGGAPIPLRWFPHPFYPHPQGDELCKLNIPVTIPASLPGRAGYTLLESGFIGRVGWPWSDPAGHYQALDYTAQTNLVVLQRHPQLGLIAATCSYVPTFFPIWGNQYTFSWEPFLERTVASGQELAWSIDYDF